MTGTTRKFLIVCTVSGNGKPQNKMYDMTINLNDIPFAEEPENYALSLIVNSLHLDEYLSYARIGRQVFIRHVRLPQEMNMNPFGENNREKIEVTE